MPWYTLHTAYVQRHRPWTHRALSCCPPCPCAPRPLRHDPFRSLLRSHPPTSPSPTHPAHLCNGAAAAAPLSSKAMSNVGTGAWLHPPVSCRVLPPPHATLLGSFLRPKGIDKERADGPRSGGEHRWSARARECWPTSLRSEPAEHAELPARRVPGEVLVRSANALPIAEEVGDEVSGALAAALKRRGGMQAVAHGARSSRARRPGRRRIGTHKCRLPTTVSY